MQLEGINDMKVLSGIELAQTVAKTLKKPVLFVSFSPDDNYDEVFKAAPYLTVQEHVQQVLDGQAVIVCDSVKEQEILYWQTIGDDGPTKTNPYKGPARVYALTIDKNGQTLNENT
jgi:hypothetical protein